MYDFLCTFCIDCLCFLPFWIRDIGQKWLIFLLYVYVLPQLDVIPLHFRQGLLREKTSVHYCAALIAFDHFDIIPACDGQIIDNQTPGHTI